MKIVPLDKKRHDRKGFRCDVDVLDTYLARQAAQDVRRKLASVFIAEDGERVAGYFAISMASFHRDSLPEEAGSRLPMYPVPAAIIGRLAISLEYQGQGLGRRLLVNALRRCALASKTVAAYAVIVDAKDEQAKAFYQRFGFQPFVDSERRLFIPMKTIDLLLEASDV